ncbi:SETMR methyltransferase, partial [Acromyrmex insinuator]
MNSTDIHIIFLYEYKLGNNAAKATRNINQAFGENTVNVRKVQRWFEKFRELATRMKVDHTTILRHLSEISKKKMDKWVPHELTKRNKLDRLYVCSSLLTRFHREPFFDRIITCDEKWVLYDNKRYAQWLDRNEACAHTPRPSLHPRKILITYIDEMHEKLKIIRPSLVNRHGPILLHDNARPTKQFRNRAKLNELKYEILQHLAYSPDLSPTNFHFFKHLEQFLRAKQYENEDRK